MNAIVEVSHHDTPLDQRSTTAYNHRMNNEADVMGEGGRATVRMKIRRLRSGILQCRIPGSGCWHDVDPTDEAMFINPDDTGRKLLDHNDHLRSAQ